MRYLTFNTLLGAFALLSFCPNSYGMDPALDVNLRIKNNATGRNQQFWVPLEQKNPSLGYEAAVNFETKVIVDDSCNTLKQAIYRPSHQKYHGHDVSTAIPYVMCLSEDVQNKRIPPKGVIIKVYGAGTPLNVTNDNSLSEEKIWAAQGYIVYCLNLRGTEGFGNSFLHSPTESHAVQSLVRDISYFTYLLKNQKQDYLGHHANKNDLINTNLPFYLTGWSFGGYLTLCHATNAEDRFYLKQFNTTISHRKMFDGYIASCPVTDIWRDIKSGTQSGSLRLPFFQHGAKHQTSTWMKNAFGNKNVIDSNSDNQELSPLYHMDRLEKPILFLHGGQDINVSPKQTVDCIKEAIRHGKQDKVFLYFDGSLEHCYPGTTQTKEFYEMTFRFMEGTSLAAKNGVKFSSPDQLESINSLVHFRTRALNPDVNRPSYQFLYQAIQTYHTSQMYKVDFDSTWQHLKETHGDFFLKALVWKKEKEKITFDRQNKRNYLTQKRQFKTNYLAKLSGFNIQDLSCGMSSGRSLHEYLNEKKTIPPMFGQAQPSYKTNQQILLDYLGDKNALLGQQKLQAYDDELKCAFQNIIKNYRLGLIVNAPILSTRLGV